MAIKLNGVEITSNKLNNLDILVERLNNTIVYDTRTKLTAPQGSLKEMFNWDEPNYSGGVLLVSLINLNTDGCVLNGRILMGGEDLTINFENFKETGRWYLGDVIPPQTGEMYGIGFISRALYTQEWLRPMTIELWFNETSTHKASDKLVITVP